MWWLLALTATPWEPEELHESYLETLATWTAEVAPAADVLARLEVRPAAR